jgi:hypothetical protein
MNESQEPDNPTMSPELDLVQLAMTAFQGTEIKHRPRNPGKAELLRRMGCDPDKAFASA